MQAPTKVVGRRLVAFILDSLIWAAIIAGSWFALTSQQSGECPSKGGGFTIGGNCRGFMSGDDGKRIAWFLVIALAAIGLFIVMQGLTGKTPGKAIVGIKVVNGQGERPGIGRTVVRELCWIVDIWLIGLIAAVASKRNQRVGDMVGGTFVVDKDFAGAVGQAQPGPVAAGAGGYGPPPSGPPAG